MAISDWDVTASNNTNIDGVNIAENCAPGGINNAIRAIMAAVRAAISNFWLSVLTTNSASAARAALNVPEATNAANALGALTPAADRLPYFTSADSAAATALTAFARTVLDDEDGATARATLEALGGAVSGSAASGSFAINRGSTVIFQVMWKDATVAGNSNTTVTYPGSFSSWSRAWCTGGPYDVTQQDNNPFVPPASCTKTTCTVHNPRDESSLVTVFAIGV